MRNRALVQQYEPGSVMKPFVVAGLLESGRLAPDEMIDAPMTLRVGLKTFRDVAQHESVLSVADVLRYSSNSGTIHLAQRFESPELHAWLAAFGFGQEMALRSAFTARGTLTDPAGWVPQDHATISIGQGVATTNLQLAAAYAVWRRTASTSRRGWSRTSGPPSLPRAVARDRHGGPQHAAAHGRGRQPAQQRGARRADRRQDRHGRRVRRRRGGYVAGRYAVSFAGMFPAERPEVVMVVTVHEPTTVTSSTLVAAPLFRAIAAEVVAHWAVAPDAPPGPAARCAEAPRVTRTPATAARTPPTCGRAMMCMMCNSGMRP
jgi:cell division protein FtsI (penicillin-binding protein 3)